MGATAGIAQGVVGGAQILAAKNQADAIKRQADFRAKQMEFNAELLDIQKKEVAKKAEKDIFSREQEVNQMLGEQKVSLAAQGIEVDGELAALFEKQEREIGAEDVQTIKNNAWRESMGLEIEQTNLRTDAAFTRLGGKESANTTKLSGFLTGTSTIIDGASTIRRSGGFSGPRRSATKRGSAGNTFSFSSTTPRSSRTA